MVGIIQKTAGACGLQVVLVGPHSETNRLRLRLSCKSLNNTRHLCAAVEGLCNAQQGCLTLPAFGLKGSA